MYHNLCKLIIVNKKISYSLVILISFTAQEESDYKNVDFDYLVCKIHKIMIQK